MLASYISICMPAYLTYTVYKRYLEVRIREKTPVEDDLEESKRIWKVMADYCRKENRDRILLINEVNGRPPIALSYNIAQQATPAGWRHDYKLAIVVKEDHQAVYNLILSFLKHLGYEAALFDRVRPARKWLLENI